MQFTLFFSFHYRSRRDGVNFSFQRNDRVPRRPYQRENGSERVKGESVFASVLLAKDVVKTQKTLSITQCQVRVNYNATVGFAPQK